MYKRVATLRRDYNDDCFRGMKSTWPVKTPRPKRLHGLTTSALVANKSRIVPHDSLLT